MDVASVTVAVHVGTHSDGANDADAPAGRPVALNVTVVEIPARRVAVTDAVTESPAVTVPDVGATERAKSKAGGDWTVKV
ncbi:MAG TPA: hypothetical protein VK723_00655 [Thermoplasmata archaeon]|nr:hypothetical protein [Thermoplasmata archaeon]